MLSTAQPQPHTGMDGVKELSKDKIPAQFCVLCRVFLNKKRISETKSRNLKPMSLLLPQTKPNRGSWKKSLMVIKKVYFVERGKQSQRELV